MKRLRSLHRLLLAVLIELLLGLAGLELGYSLQQSAHPLLALAAVTITAAASLGGLWIHLREGRLHMALRCPRLDALDLVPGSRSAPWSTLAAADQALATLDQEGRRFRAFFPNARRDLLQGAVRAIDAHRQWVRAERALTTAPQGEARRQLEVQSLRATREIAELTRMLRELRYQLIASTMPLSSAADALPSLQRLGLRTAALGDAVDELAVCPESSHPGHVSDRNGEVH